MIKYLRTGACFLFCILAIGGCGQAKLPDSIDTDTLSVNSRGEVTSYLVRDFEKEYYDLSELTSMAMGEAAQYNTAHAAGNGTPVTVQTIERLEEGSPRVRMMYLYDSAETFSSYNDKELFFGTVQEAVSENYPFTENPLSSVKDGTLVTDAWLKQEALGKHILITDEKAVIYCPYKVTHISGGAVLNEDGSVDATQAEDPVYILMKK